MQKVRSGLDCLLGDKARIEQLKGARVGLLVNPTSVTADLVHAVDALRLAGVQIHRLFGPEHGIRGEAQDMEAVDENRDPITGIPTISLYGHDLESLKPPKSSLEDLDILIADIQDIGSRYYTYVYTIGLAMEVAGQTDTDVWVLDRPNPINGVDVRGNTVRDEYRSFVGMQPIAVRHGMTAGELAHYFNRFGGWSCDLDVIECEGWKRDMWFDQTGLPWVMPSPNMPTLDTAIVYPGQCILEGTNASEGRGTTRPFELFGAPYIDAVELREALTKHDLPGVAYRDVSFRPMFQKHAEVTCAGLQIHVTDRNAFDSISLTYAIVGELLQLYPEAFGWREQAYEFVQDRLAIDLLLGDAVLRAALEDGADPVEVSQISGKGRALFDDQRAQCLIYD